MIGKTWKGWTVLEKAGIKKANVYWLCKCGGCGLEKPVPQARINAEKRPKCVCYNPDGNDYDKSASRPWTEVSDLHLKMYIRDLKAKKITSIEAVAYYMNRPPEVIKAKLAEHNFF